MSGAYDECQGEEQAGCRGRPAATLVKVLGSSLAPVSEAAGLLWAAIMFRTPDSPRRGFFPRQHQQLFLEAELKRRQFDQSSFYALLSGHTEE